MNKSQYRAVDNYEEKQICKCGRRADHASGLCWGHYTERYGTELAVVTSEDRKRELEKLGIWSEDRAERIDKALAWNAENNPKLKRMALEAIERRRKAADD